MRAAVCLGFLPAGHATAAAAALPCPLSCPCAYPLCSDRISSTSLLVPFVVPSSWPALHSSLCQAASLLTLPSPAAAIALPFVDMLRWCLPLRPRPGVPHRRTWVRAFRPVGAYVLSCLGCDPRSCLSWGLTPSGVPVASSCPSACARLPCSVHLLCPQDGAWVGGGGAQGFADIRK